MMENIGVVTRFPACILEHFSTLRSFGIVSGYGEIAQKVHII